MKSAFCSVFYGLGNGATDPVTGEPTLAQRIRKLGVTVPSIWNFTDQAAAAEEINGLPPSTLCFAVAISCGANRLATLLALCPRRTFAGVYAIAPSSWCNSGQPPISDNAPNFWVFNGPWYKSLPPGLSTFAPQRAEGSKAPPIIRKFSNTWHPCDSDVIGVQNPIINDIHTLVGA